MTAKEKAKELIQMFKAAIWKNGNPNNIDAHAKKCALSCVDEILGLDVWYSPHDAEEGKTFYEEVKKEIEQL